MSSERAGSRRTSPEREHEDSVVAAGERQPAEALYDPDVLLDVPVVHVEELSLKVEELTAHIALQSRLSELLNIDVGVHVSLDTVELEAKGVEATAQLKARLERVEAIIARTLGSVDDNPQIIESLARLADTESRGQHDGYQEETEGAGAVSEEPGAVCTPAAGNRAGDLGVDLGEVEGTGSGGRITVKDVEKAARARR